MVGTAALQCTWKSRGMQDQFTSAVCVRNACFGHMVASVWDGAHHTLRALHHCVTKNMTTPATNTNVCAWIDKAHTRRFVRATLDADHLLL